MRCIQITTQIVFTSHTKAALITDAKFEKLILNHFDYVSIGEIPELGAPYKDDDLIGMHNISFFILIVI